MVRKHRVLLAAVTGFALVFCGFHFADAQQAAREGGPRIVYKFSDEGEVGFAVVQQGRNIPLTFAENGGTNSTVLRLNGKDIEFDTQHWQQRPIDLGKTKEGRKRYGHRAIWLHHKIKVNQVVEVVQSQTGNLDTCLVYYLMENTDKQPHQVGLRTMIDTQIANNDGNSFALAGRVVTGSVDMKSKDIPTAIEVRERPDPKNPGVVAQLTLKVGGQFDAPDRCTLTHWPGVPFPHWDVPVNQIGHDAAVAIYWNPRPLQPSERRLVGYAYGLGVLTVAK